MKAVTSDVLRIITKVIDSGANVNATDKVKLCTCISYAVKNEYVKQAPGWF